MITKIIKFEEDLNGTKEISFNDTVYVRVGPIGERLWAEHYKDFKAIGAPVPEIRRDAKGWTKMQLHEVANIFGPGMSMTSGLGAPIEPRFRVRID